jgi:hypothetical protein
MFHETAVPLEFTNGWCSHGFRLFCDQWTERILRRYRRYKIGRDKIENETEGAVEISLLLTRNSEVAYWKQHQIDGDESVPIEPPDYEYSSGEYCVFVRGSEEGTRSSVCSTEFFEEGECYYLLASRFPDGIRFSQSLSSVNCRG